MFWPSIHYEYLKHCHIKNSDEIAARLQEREYKYTYKYSTIYEIREPQVR